MQIGMTVPSMISGLDRDAILGWCRGIDQGPWSTLAVGERIAYPNIELFTTLAAAAAVTERARLMATVVVAPAHPAIEIAKMAATIDVVSGGRLDLGVGVGGRDEDYRALERPFAGAGRWAAAVLGRPRPEGDRPLGPVGHGHRGLPARPVGRGRRRWVRPHRAGVARRGADRGAPAGDQLLVRAGRRRAGAPA